MELERGGRLRQRLDAVDAGQQVDACVRNLRLLACRHVGEPAAPRVGHVVGCGDTVDACHHDERSPSGWVGLEPEHLGDWHGRSAAHGVHGDGLPAEIVGGEDRPRVGRWWQSHHHRAAVVLVVDRPGQIGQQRLARQAALLGTAQAAHTGSPSAPVTALSHSASRAAISPRSRVEVFGFARSSSSIRRCGRSPLWPPAVPDCTSVLLHCPHSPPPPVAESSRTRAWRRQNTTLLG